MTPLRDKILAALNLAGPNGSAIGLLYRPKNTPVSEVREAVVSLVTAGLVVEVNGIYTSVAALKREKQFQAELVKRGLKIVRGVPILGFARCEVVT